MFVPSAAPLSRLQLDRRRLINLVDGSRLPPAHALGPENLDARKAELAAELAAKKAAKDKPANPTAEA